MNFRSIADLRLDIKRNLHRIPADVDVIVGIPRSGMLPASIIALDLNVPLAEVQGFAEGRLLSTGSTRKVEKMKAGFDQVRHALVVDDSTNTGNSLAEARAMLAPLEGRVKITYAAVYGVAGQADNVDLTFEIVPQPRVFEWNIMHSWVLAHACLDIDGVLCHDPLPEENDDGPAYECFLGSAKPLLIPSVLVGTLVTSRLEKYRAHTEDWLKRHGVQYEKLIMLDVATAEERRALGLHGKFKGEYYRDCDASLFIESELRQAQTIADISGRPVLSLEGAVMCYPGLPTPRQIVAKARRRMRHLVKHAVLGRFKGLRARAWA